MVLLPRITTQTISKVCFGLMTFLLVFTSISPSIYADSSPCGNNISQFNCSCPPGISEEDCHSELGPWVSYKPSTSGASSSCSANASSTSIVLTGADTQTKMMNFFVSRGLTTFQAAGIVGNLEQESGGNLNPEALEAKGSGKDGYTGHGIIQWSWTRWRTDYGEAGTGMGSPEARAADSAKISDLTDFAPYPPKPPLDPNTLLGFAVQNNSKWQDLGTQVAFMMQEIGPDGSYKGVLPQIKASTDVAGAATIWFKDYESPGDGSLPARIVFGEKILQTYGTGVGVGSTVDTGTDSTTTAGNGCAAATTCSTSNTTVAADLSTVRQQVVCLAQKELTNTWTPLPAVPRMQYLTYTDNVPEEWCADFASWLYNKAGYPFIGGSSGGWRLPAVDQIEQIGKADGNFHWHDVAGYTPKPGDLAIHKNAAKKVSHVNVVMSVSGTNLTLIGGDQGDGPYGGKNSASIVSQINQIGFGGSDTIGYVSPD